MTLPYAIVSFLLALHAAGHACLALDPARLPLVALLLALATVLGLRRDGRVDEGESGGGRNAAWGLYGALLVAAFSFAGGGHPASVALALYMLISFQILFHVVPRAGRGHVPLLVNAQALAVLASLVGGPLAVSALAGHAMLLVVWLAVDHRVRRQRPLAGAVRAAVPPIVLLAAWFGLAFTLAPSQPNAELIESASASVKELEAGAVAGAWVKLLVAAGLGLALIVLVRKLLGASEEEKVPRKERPKPAGPRAHARAARPGLGAEPVDLSGARGRVVRTYLRFLRRLARRGVVREPSRTPAELAATLPGPARELAELFGRARYSREPVSEADATRADSDARTILRALR